MQGLVLSAWRIAGLIGNNISTLIYTVSGSFLHVPLILILTYIITISIVYDLIKTTKEK